MIPRLTNIPSTATPSSPPGNSLSLTHLHKQPLLPTPPPHLLSPPPHFPGPHPVKLPLLSTPPLTILPPQSWPPSHHSLSLHFPVPFLTSTLSFLPFLSSSLPLSSSSLSPPSSSTNSMGTALPQTVHKKLTQSLTVLSFNARSIVPNFNCITAAALLHSPNVKLGCPLTFSLLRFLFLAIFFSIWITLFMVVVL